MDMDKQKEIMTDVTQRRLAGQIRTIFWAYRAKHCPAVSIAGYQVIGNDRLGYVVALTPPLCATNRVYTTFAQAARQATEHRQASLDAYDFRLQSRQKSILRESVLNPKQYSSTVATDGRYVVVGNEATGYVVTRRPAMHPGDLIAPVSGILMDGGGALKWAEDVAKIEGQLPMNMSHIRRLLIEGYQDAGINAEGAAYLAQRQIERILDWGSAENTLTELQEELKAKGARQICIVPGLKGSCRHVWKLRDSFHFAADVCGSKVGWESSVELIAVLPGIEGSLRYLWLLPDSSFYAADVHVESQNGRELPAAEVYEEAKRQAIDAGYMVHEDSDQPDLWVWYNHETSNYCDFSPDTEQEAWDWAIGSHFIDGFRMGAFPA